MIKQLNFKKKFNKQNRDQIIECQKKYNKQNRAQMIIYEKILKS